MDPHEVLRRISSDTQSLIEIYILDASIQDWQRVVERANGLGCLKSFTQDGSSVPLDAAADLVVKEFDHEYFLGLSISGQHWWSHLPDAGYVDFQGEPRDVHSPQDVMNIVEFMRELHAATAKTVLLLPETLRPAKTLPYFTVPADMG